MKKEELYRWRILPSKWRILIIKRMFWFFNRYCRKRRKL